MAVNLEAGWREASLAGTVFEAGNSVEYITGTWRTLRPVRDTEACTHCMLCWVYCPDSIILVENSKVIGFDYDHCKGCGICARECPPKCHAIEMVLETAGGGGRGDSTKRDPEAIEKDKLNGLVSM